MQIRSTNLSLLFFKLLCDIAQFSLVEINIGARVHLNAER